MSKLKSHLGSLALIESSIWRVCMFDIAHRWQRWLSSVTSWWTVSRCHDRFRPLKGDGIAKEAFIAHWLHPAFAANVPSALPHQVCWAQSSGRNIHPSVVSDNLLMSSMRNFRLLRILSYRAPFMLSSSVCLEWALKFVWTGELSFISSAGTMGSLSPGWWGPEGAGGARGGWPEIGQQPLTKNKPLSDGENCWPFLSKMAPLFRGVCVCAYVFMCVCVREVLKSWEHCVKCFCCCCCFEHFGDFPSICDFLSA